uniref:Retrotransposon gag domain-containing protein n=1 Tax=Arundo donax TaxID=35708 RepID=A0A0A9EQ42_ARUDO
MVWLLGSMEPSVCEQVENLQTPAEVWKEIGEQFSGKTNKMQVTRVLHEMRNLKQGQRSIIEYAGELKRLYRDLEFFHPFKCDDHSGMIRLREWFQPILVQTFFERIKF